MQRKMPRQDRFLGFRLALKLWSFGILWVAMALGCGPGDPPIKSQELVSGVIHHQLYLIEGPWAIHVLEIDLPKAWGKGVRLRTARFDPAKGELAKTSVLAAGAIAAINGDFFVQAKRVRTTGLHIHQGTLFQAPQGRTGFGLTAEGEPLIAAFGFDAGLVTVGGQVLPITAFNREPGAGRLAFYNGTVKGQQDTVHAEVGFQLQNLSPHSVLNDTVTARVLQSRRRAWPLRLKSDQWLIAAGPEHPRAAQIVPGDTVRLFCNLPPATRQLVEAVGGGPRIVRDGVVSVEWERERFGRGFAAERHPRTAIGYSRGGQRLFLVTVDGRQPGYSVGMTLEELAEFMVSQLARYTQGKTNAHQALNMDGGGSTTMVVNRQVVNRPSDQTGERPVANALMVVVPSAKAAL